MESGSSQSTTWAQQLAGPSQSGLFWDSNREPVDWNDQANQLVKSELSGNRVFLGGFSILLLDIFGSFSSKGYGGKGKMVQLFLPYICCTPLLS